LIFDQALLELRLQIVECLLGDLAHVLQFFFGVEGRKDIVDLLGDALFYFMEGNGLSFAVFLL
jgi:hypothetical protein